MTNQFDCSGCNTLGGRCLPCRERMIHDALRLSKEEPNPCEFRGLINFGRVLGVHEGGSGKRCEGPRKTYLWNGQPGAHTYTVCREHDGEFRYWYRAAVEIGTDGPEASGHGAGIQRTHPAAEESVVDAPAVASSVPSSEGGR